MVLLQLLADQVLMFGGGGAICGNHDSAIWETLKHLDYVGGPWSLHYGKGGEATVHSYRNRKAMLQVLDYAEREGLTAPGNDYEFFVKTMLNMNANGHGNFSVATREDTLQFAGVHDLATKTGVTSLPLVVAGTQPKLLWSERQALLQHCPELRIIFPSLHEPACFGSHPDPQACKANICALQDEPPTHGC